MKSTATYACVSTPQAPLCMHRQSIRAANNLHPKQKRPRGRRSKELVAGACELAHRIRVARKDELRHCADEPVAHRQRQAAD
eukprot:4622927-Pleurochrysis_carterae.AAC.3